LRGVFFFRNIIWLSASHVDVIKLIFEKSIQGDGGAMGKELLQDLAKLKTKFQILKSIRPVL